MLKRTKICFIVCQMLQKPKKTPKKISPNFGHTRGGAGRGGKPRWKVVTLSSVIFLNPSLRGLNTHQCHFSRRKGRKNCWILPVSRFYDTPFILTGPFVDIGSLNMQEKCSNIFLRIESLRGYILHPVKVPSTKGDIYVGPAESPPPPFPCND